MTLDDFYMYLHIAVSCLLPTYLPFHALHASSNERDSGLRHLCLYPKLLREDAHVMYLASVFFPGPDRTSILAAVTGSRNFLQEQKALRI